MPSSRRALLRAISVGTLGAFAGCAGDERPDPGLTVTRTTEPTRTLERTAAGRARTERATTEPTAERTATATTDANGQRAIEFAHRSPVLDSGVGDTETWYHARVFGDEREAREIDASSLDDGFSGRNRTAVEQFVGDTDFESSALVAVQAAVPSPKYGLAFDFVDRDAAPSQVVAHVEAFDSNGGDSVTSTLFVRVPRVLASGVAVTVADRAGARLSRPQHAVETFTPPNETLYESLNRTRSPRELPNASGALVTTPGAAQEFAPTDQSAAEFVRETAFERWSVLAVQTRMPSSGYLMWPRSVEQFESKVAVRVRQQNFGGGLNAEFDHFALFRIPAVSPEYGVVTVRTWTGPERTMRTRTIRVSSDPDEWPNAEATASEHRPRTAIEPK